MFPFFAYYYYIYWIKFQKVLIFYKFLDIIKVTEIREGVYADRKERIFRQTACMEG